MNDFLAQTGNGEGMGYLFKPGIRVWVEDETGKVVAGIEAKRAA
jgi:hypothetical protein